MADCGGNSDNEEMNRMAAGMARMMRPIIIQPTEKHTASIIFLHGSGSNGPDVQAWVEMVVGSTGFSFPHVKLIYPSATPKPYTAACGMLSTVWFDRAQISPFAPEQTSSIDQACDFVEELVTAEEKSGIPRSRIIVGGFSMGGGLALYYGYRRAHSLAGVFALSSFLSEKSIVYEHLGGCSGPLPPLFQCHGKRDPLVLYEWGMMTHKQMKQLRVPATFHFFPNLCHELGRDEMTRLKEWIDSVVPEKQSSAL